VDDKVNSLKGKMFKAGLSDWPTFKPAEGGASDASGAAEWDWKFLF
jgi:hypothetical protein